MYITLKNIKTISGPLAHHFELSSNIIRFIEFENVVAFWLDENGKEDKIVGVKFSKEGGIHRYYIAWEFQYIDGYGKAHAITSLEKIIRKEIEVVRCHVWGIDRGFYLDPNTGTIVDTFPTK